MSAYPYALALAGLGLVVAILADAIWQQLRKP